MTLEIAYYPYDDPIILTDVIFENFGGNTDDTSLYQRKMAYRLAEEDVSIAIGTYLSPTRITGSYPYEDKIVLDHTHVKSIILTRFIDFEDTVYYTISGTSNVYVSLWNENRGIVDMGYAVSNCHCHSTAKYPYKVQIVYDTGLQSGTSYNPNLLMGLTTYAQIILNEMIGFGNEGVGDVGITEFSNQQYREKRYGLVNTVFGNSPKANFANKLLKKFRKLQHVGLGQ